MIFEGEGGSRGGGDSNNRHSIADGLRSSVTREAVAERQGHAERKRRCNHHKRVTRQPLAHNPLGRSPFPGRGRLMAVVRVLVEGGGARVGHRSRPQGPLVRRGQLEATAGKINCGLEGLSRMLGLSSLLALCTKTSDTC